MNVKYIDRKHTRSLKRAPKRKVTFKKLNNQLGRPFSAVLGTVGIKKPVINLFKSVKASLGGKNKKYTYKKKY